MGPHIETPAPGNFRLLAGHFRETRDYSAWRSGGTRDWLLIYTVAGAGYFGHARGQFTSMPGDLVLIRPETLHDYGTDQSTGRWELLWAHFQPRLHWMDWLTWPPEAPGLMRISLQEPAARQTARRLLLRISHLARGALRRREDFALCALEELLLWCDVFNPLSGQSSIDPRIRRAMDFLCQNLAKKINLDDVAAACGLSISRLAHLFSQQTGTTPQQFLERQRLERAKQLLAMTSRSIQTIATDVGYENPFYFSLRFKRYTGQSPRTWRLSQTPN